MKSSKFQLDFGTPEARQQIKIKASEAGKSMNQYIMDCIDGKTSLIAPGGSSYFKNNSKDIYEVRTQKVKEPQSSCKLCGEKIDRATRNAHIATCKPKDCKHSWKSIGNLGAKQCKHCDLEFIPAKADEGLKGFIKGMETLKGVGTPLKYKWEVIEQGGGLKGEAFTSPIGLVSSSKK